MYHTSMSYNDSQSHCMYSQPWSTSRPPVWYSTACNKSHVREKLQYLGLRYETTTRTRFLRKVFSSRMHKTTSVGLEHHLKSFDKIALHVLHLPGQLAFHPAMKRLAPSTPTDRASLSYLAPPILAADCRRPDAVYAGTVRRSSIVNEV